MRDGDPHHLDDAVARRGRGRVRAAAGRAGRGAGADVVATEVVPDDRGADRGRLRALRRRRTLRVRLHDRRDRPDPRRRHARGHARRDRARGARIRRGDACGRRDHTPLGILTRGVAGIAGPDADRQLPRQPEGDRPALPRGRPHAGARVPRRCGDDRDRAAAASAGRTASASRCTDVTLSARRGARRWSSSGPTARASRRCCGSSRRCCAPTPARARVLGRELPGEGWAVRGRIGFARPRAAALPRADRAREPAPTTRACTASRRRGSRSCWSAVGMERRADEPVRTLSRGMVQRLASAAPSCTTPSCCCSTSRWPTSTRRRPSWSSR